MLFNGASFLYLARDGEGDGFDQSGSNLVGSSNFTFADIYSTFGHKGHTCHRKRGKVSTEDIRRSARRYHTSLRINRLEFREQEEFIIFVFIVTDHTITGMTGKRDRESVTAGYKCIITAISLPFSSKIKHLCVSIIERHVYTGRSIQKFLFDRLFQIVSVPEVELTVAHTRETSGDQAIRVSKPYHARSLDALMTATFLHNFVASYVKDSNALVSACGGNQ